MANEKIVQIPLANVARVELVTEETTPKTYVVDTKRWTASTSSRRSSAPARAATGDTRRRAQTPCGIATARAGNIAI